MHIGIGSGLQVKTGHGTTNWFQIGKGVHQGCMLLILLDDDDDDGDASEPDFS